LPIRNNETRSQPARGNRASAAEHSARAALSRSAQCPRVPEAGPSPAV